MNTMMWTHPITAQHIAKLRDDWGVDGKTPGKGWFEVLVPGGSSTSFSSPPLLSILPSPPSSQSGHLRAENGADGSIFRRATEKELACGDVGAGAMMEWTQIVDIIKDRLKLPPLDTGAPKLELK